jgi:hypothetical protein
LLGRGPAKSCRIDVENDQKFALSVVGIWFFRGKVSPTTADPPRKRRARDDGVMELIQRVKVITARERATCASFMELTDPKSELDTVYTGVGNGQSGVGNVYIFER